MKFFITFIFFFIFLANIGLAQKKETFITVNPGNYRAGSLVVSNQSHYYEFSVLGLSHPKFIIQDLYMLFNSSPSFRDSLNIPYFKIISDRKINKQDLTLYLTERGYSLGYFKNDFELSDNIEKKD